MNSNFASSAIPYLSPSIITTIHCTGRPSSCCRTPFQRSFHTHGCHGHPSQSHRRRREEYTERSFGDPKIRLWLSSPNDRGRRNRCFSNRFQYRPLQRAHFDHSDCDVCRSLRTHLMHHKIHLPKSAEHNH